MAEFYPISAEEMHDFLTGLRFQPIRPVDMPNAREKIYARAFSRGDLKVSVRVMTSIEGGEARGVGEDAIYVMVFAKTPEGGIVPVTGKKRVHRVKGWKKNLANRLEGWTDLIRAFCPDCGFPMQERINKTTRNKFLGCCRYPICRGTRPLTDDRVKALAA